MLRRFLQRALIRGFAVALAFAGCVIPLNTPGPSSSSGSTQGSVSTDGAPSPDGAVPSGSWMNVTANLANMASQCGNMTDLSVKPDEDLLIAGIALDALWASRDGGNSWQPLSAPGDAATSIINRPTAIVYDPLQSSRFWESGIYNAGGVYVTNDDGLTFTPTGDIQHVDLVSIDFTDPDRKTLVAGRHESAQMVFVSSDGGMTWTNIGGGLPPNSDCDFPLVIDSQTYLVGCDGEGGGPIGVYRSSDGGNTWNSMTTYGGIDAPLVASDGSIYWSTPSGGGIARSIDQGQTWTNVSGANTVATVSPIELPDGRIVTIGPEFGLQYVLASADHGATWKPVSSTLPYSNPVGVVYSVPQKAFFIWHWTCVTSTDPVPADAIMRYDFDYTTN